LSKFIEWLQHTAGQNNLRGKNMSVNRRHFLINTGVAIAAGAISAAGKNSVLKATIKPTVNDLQNWANVREQFDTISRDYIHLSSFFLASHPRPVREAIEKYRQAIDDNPFLFVEQNIMEMPGRIQSAVAAYTGGKPEEIALTNSTTMGLAFIYQGLPLKPGQEILTTAHDHFVHHEAIRLAANRAGGTVKKIELFDFLSSVSEEDIVSRIKKAITPKTRAVGITWVHSGTGLKLPVRLISHAIADANKGRAEPDRILLVVTVSTVSASKTNRLPKWAPISLLPERINGFSVRAGPALFWRKPIIGKSCK
jgi:isopenicillin-N epimerase